jgi:hypothetical protein
METPYMTEMTTFQGDPVWAENMIKNTSAAILNKTPTPWVIALTTSSFFV